MAPPRNVPFVPSILEILSAQNMLPSQRRRHPWSTQPQPAQAPAQEAPEVTDMNTPLSLPHTPEPPDFSRFEMELEFVESLANPMFLNHIAARMYLNRPEFIAYLDYLQYWTEPPYLQFLTYPGPTLRHLELLQHERFRREIIAPDVAKMLEREAERGAIRWHKGNIYG